jgi:hypothetical protein
MKGQTTMKQENRVLGRIGARELTPRESENVTGGFRVRTLTLCTFSASSANPAPDGDAGECS